MRHQKTSGLSHVLQLCSEGQKNRKGCHPPQEVSGESLDGAWLQAAFSGCFDSSCRPQPTHAAERSAGRVLSRAGPECSLPAWQPRLIAELLNRE